MPQILLISFFIQTYAKIDLSLWAMFPGKSLEQIDPSSWASFSPLAQIVHEILLQLFDAL